MEEAIECGSGVDETHKGGDTPLMIAAMGGHNAMVRFLIKNGANTELRNKGGATALMRASARGRYETCRKYTCNKNTLLSSVLLLVLICIVRVDDDVTAFDVSCLVAIDRRNTRQLTIDIVFYLHTLHVTNFVCNTPGILIDEGNADAEAKDNQGHSVIMHAHLGHHESTERHLRKHLDERRRLQKKKEEEARNAAVSSGETVKSTEL